MFEAFCVQGFCILRFFGLWFKLLGKGCMRFEGSAMSYRKGSRKGSVGAEGCRGFGSMRRGLPGALLGGVAQPHSLRTKRTLKGLRVHVPYRDS